jgi:hypothetical protein
LAKSARAKASTTKSAAKKIAPKSVKTSQPKPKAVSKTAKNHPARGVLPSASLG